MQKICKKSGVAFSISDEDKAFYEKMNVPLPTLCPDERQKRRLAWRNERTLHRRKCSGSGRSIVCMYPENTPFPVYDHSYFFSDKWNGLAFGREFDFNRPFFEQFSELFQVVPRILNYSVSNENAEYGNLSSWNKDCYMLFESDNNRDSLYCENTFRSLNLVDCSFCKECQLCYQCIDIYDCYELRYSLNCKNCSSSWFLKNCIGCKNCFGSVNLRNKEYYFLNEKLIKDEYEAKMAALDLQSFQSVNKLFVDFLVHAQKFPNKFINGFQNENCTGDYLNNCKDSHFCYDSSELRDCKYVYSCERIKDGYDLHTYGGFEGSERVYECNSVGRGSFNVAFGNNVYQNMRDSFYCDNCIDSADLFGCISLKHNRFCILNKQYSEVEYFKLRNRIVEHMRKSSADGQAGEYGEFFPIERSPFAYNETMAQIYYPLTKEEALRAGYKWKDPDPKEYIPQKVSLPERIADVGDEILDEILACEETGKNFKIQKIELDFYRKMGLPLPRFCPDQRYLRRIELRNPRRLCNRNCQKCGKEIITTYPSGNKAIVYCEECYLEACV
ncbi:MAG: hypothetical protein WC285_05130 [Candidatus Gracilibacteria bacterium]|jgi:hypothetical protein